MNYNLLYSFRKYIFLIRILRIKLLKSNLNFDVIRKNMIHALLLRIRSASVCTSNRP